MGTKLIFPTQLGHVQGLAALIKRSAISVLRPYRATGPDVVFACSRIATKASHRNVNVSESLLVHSERFIAKINSKKLVTVMAIDEILATYGSDASWVIVNFGHAVAHAQCT